MIPIAGFAPDAEPTTPGILTDCSMLLPTEDGFEAAPTAISSGVAALAAACRNFAVLTKNDGTNRVFAGTQTALYELTGTTWTDRSSGVYAIGTEGRWSFTQFANVSIASNVAHRIQASTTGNFADAAAGAPRAKIVFAVAGFVMAAHYDDGTLTEDGWYCSAFQDHTGWTVGTNQSQKGRLFGVPGGFTAGIRLGDSAVLFKETGGYIGTYVGAPFVWTWAEIPGAAGCVGQDAICDISTENFNAILFVARDNIYVFDGTRPRPIATGKTRQWFVNRVDSQFIYKVICSYDRASKRVYIYFPPSGSGGALTECLVWHTERNTFTRANRTIQAAGQYVSSGLTWDGLGTPYATWNDLPDIPYDSPFWSSSSRVPAIFDSSNNLLTINGAGANATFTTGDYGDDEAVTICDQVRVRFLSTPTSAVMEHFYRFKQGDAISLSSSNAIDDGEFDCRESARWHRFAFSTTGTMKVSALRPRLKPAGAR